MTGGMNIGIVFGGVATGLHDQWLQWDSRNVDYTGMILSNEVGSTVWDLPVTSEDSPLQYSASRAASGSPSVFWSDIGGEPDNGPWTMMMKVGAIIEDGGANSTAGFANCRVRVTGASSRLLDFRLQADWEESEGTEYHGTNQGFMRANLSGPNLENDIQVSQTQSGPPTVATENLLLTIVTDPLGVEFHMFYGMTEITADVGDLNHSTSNDGDISAALLANLPQPFTTSSADFGGHLDFSGTLVEGDAWGQVVGAVGFRGSPTTADLTFWNAYFTP